MCTDWRGDYSGRREYSELGYQGDWENVGKVGDKRGGLDSKRSSEAPRGVVRFGAVVIDEDVVVSAITKKGSAEFSDIGWCLNPTRSF